MGSCIAGAHALDVGAFPLEHLFFSCNDTPESIRSVVLKAMPPMTIARTCSQ